LKKLRRLFVLLLLRKNFFFERKENRCECRGRKIIKVCHIKLGTHDKHVRLEVEVEKGILEGRVAGFYWSRGSCVESTVVVVALSYPSSNFTVKQQRTK